MNGEKRNSDRVSFETSRQSPHSPDGTWRIGVVRGVLSKDARLSSSEFFMWPVPEKSGKEVKHVAMWSQFARSQDYVGFVKICGPRKRSDYCVGLQERKFSEGIRLAGKMSSKWDIKGKTMFTSKFEREPSILVFPKCTQKTEAVAKTLPQKAANISPCPKTFPPSRRNLRRAHFAETTAKPKSLVAAAPRIPGPEVRLEAGHAYIVSSKYENHTAEQVVTKLHGLVDAKEMGVIVDQLKKASNQKVERSQLSDINVLSRPAIYTWDSHSTRLGSSPLSCITLCSRCPGFGYGKRYYKDVFNKRAHCEGITFMQSGNSGVR
ncbi:hypothetical protein EVAR_17583_1 [Eumeta japonica]|uniref:Uncharacterized protein n=1 Tax=Eumeta variegata TaxID=151549 RepID=A0A4C1UBU9_EUMVA|nr:hypothetical protein EVAR_17583_1 [Eumeta japonica]